METWNAFRVAYNQLALSLPNSDWYTFTLGDKQANKASAAPASQTSRVYADSPDSKRSLWIDTTGGKSTLTLYDTLTKQDKVLLTQDGMHSPVRWLNDQVVVYRIVTTQETADYAYSLNGGAPVKIHDVVNVGRGGWVVLLLGSNEGTEIGSLIAQSFWNGQKLRLLLPKRNQKRRSESGFLKLLLLSTRT